MKAGTGRIRVALALGLATALATQMSPAALADHPQPEPDIAQMDYSPIGHFKPGDQTPAPTDFDTQLKPLMDGLRFNPSGKYNAFDTNVFEVLGLPYRAAGDKSASDAYGNGGDSRHGYCDSDRDPDTTTDRRGDLAKLAGECPNHQLEYSRYFAETMRDILGDYGVTIRRYRFMNPGGSNTQAGTAINTAAVVPGADHPDETVIVSGHYDQTDEGPASAWDSAEGHAQVIRIAKILADYWKRTGTRPSATVKFVPWDAEESGTLGSADYAANNIVPGEEYKVRGYWNTDPCAGGYPAYRFGNPQDRVDLGIQIANPDRLSDPANIGDSFDPPAEARERIEAFNEKVPGLVEEVFEHLDDSLSVRGQATEIFVASSEAPDGKGDIGEDVLIQNSRPVLFSSDWVNFEDLGIPFFNPGPDITGPSSQLEYGNPDGLAILHTPNDNIQTLNAYTSDDQSGQKFSEGWIKGMEMCAHLLGWGMLQTSQGGGQETDEDVVAYYEALPNEATEDKPVRFNADGTYQYASADGSGFVDESLFEYEWDFGDGSTGSGERVEHVYAEAGKFVSTLTVTNRETGQSDTMSVPVTVIPAANPQLAGPELTAPDEDANGNFDLSWSRVGGDREKYVVEESTEGGLIFSDDAEANIAERWDVATTGSRMQGWQNTGGAPKTPAGDKSRSGESYWSGIFPTDPPAAGQSTMTLKEPIAIPADSDAALSYWSYYRNDLTDLGTVEVAVDDGNADTPLDWATVDAIRGDDQTAWLPGLDIALEGQPAQTEEMVQRRADLSRYAGQKVLLRFRNDITTRNGVFIQKYGWYVDDIQVEADTFKMIAEATTDTFEVTGRDPGEYAYRVRAVYEDGTPTAASNTERVRVTGEVVPLTGRGENIEGIARVKIDAPNEVELAGDWAFVSTDDPDGEGPRQGALVIVNIDDPTRPFIESYWDAGDAGLTDISFGDVDLSPDASLAALTNAHCDDCAEGEVPWVVLVDVSDKANPKLAGTIVDDGDMDYVHTSTLDNKMLYTNPQVAAFFPQPGNAHITAFDISDPSNPVKKATISGPASDAGLAHDSYIDHRPDGKTLMYGASVTLSDVFDISDPLEPEWLQTTASPQYTISHDVQPNHDRSIIVVDDEGAAGGQLDESVSACGKVGSGPASADSGSVHFFEAAPDGTFAKAGAVHLGSFNAPTNVNTGACVAHVFWQAPNENRMTQAYYRTGAFVLEFEDPANPKMLGWFVADGGAMYWSNKPHNGYMYATDMEHGLDILKYTGEGGTRWPATAGPAEEQRAARQGVPYVPMEEAPAGSPAPGPPSDTPGSSQGPPDRAPAPQGQPPQSQGPGSGPGSERPADTGAPTGASRRLGAFAFKTKVRRVPGRAGRRTTLVLVFTDKSGKRVARVKVRRRAGRSATLKVRGVAVAGRYSWQLRAGGKALREGTVRVTPGQGLALPQPLRLRARLR